MSTLDLTTQRERTDAAMLRKYAMARHYPAVAAALLSFLVDHLYEGGTVHCDCAVCMAGWEALAWEGPP